MKLFLKVFAVPFLALTEHCNVAFIIGSIFYQLGYEQSSIQGREGALFFILVNGAFSIAQATIAFIKERLLVVRERAAGVYSTGPFFLAKTVHPVT